MEHESRLSDGMSATARAWADFCGVAFGWISADLLKLGGGVRLVAGCERCGYVAAATVVSPDGPSNEVEALKQAAMQEAADRMSAAAIEHGCLHWVAYVAKKMVTPHGCAPVATEGTLQ